LKYKRVVINRGEKKLIDVDVSKVFTEETFIIGLPQDRTETLMSQKLQEMGVIVKYGTKVIDVVTSADKATVSFENGETKSYDWVIGADGVNSTVRKSLGIKFEGYDLDEEWSIADVEVASGFDGETIQAWMLDGEAKERDAMLMIPIAKNRVRLVSSTPDSLKTVPIPIDVAKVRRSGTFTIAVRQAAQYVQGRVVLAGDAAHAHSPVGGRGMNVGIDDGQAVAAAIVNNTVDQYEATRKKVASKVIKDTERIRKLLVSRNFVTYLLLRVVAWGIQNVKFLQRKFAKQVTRY